MIAYLEGRIAETTEQTCVVVTTSGVGYEVYLPVPTLSSCTKGDASIYYIASVVREDAFELFGFSTWDERETFNLLRTINRVGPRTALAILSIFSPEDLLQITITEDILALTRVPGIGKKTAQQVFLDLKYKFKGKAMSATVRAISKSSAVLQDAVAGLLNLGYAEDEAHTAASQVLAETPDLDVGELLRASLKKMAKGK